MRSGVWHSSHEIYNWQQYGSYALKYVLPMMVPDLNYDHLDVQNGGMPMVKILECLYFYSKPMQMEGSNV